MLDSVLKSFSGHEAPKGMAEGVGWCREKTLYRIKVRAGTSLRSGWA
jgi:hypothetical protein